MPDFNEIFSKRLRSAREMKYLSMAALSHLLGGAVSPQAIYKYEAGKMLPGSGLLAELSKVLDVPVDFFFRPFNVSISGIEFRKKSKLGVKERRSIEGLSADRVERYVEIEDISGLKHYNQMLRFPVKDENDVLGAVRDLRNNWGLEQYGIVNVIKLLEDHGVIVIEFEAGKDFDGLSGRANDIPVIVLNKNFPSAERRRFTALHELGHLVMDIDEQTDDRRVESLCNLFASEMLLPREAFKKEVGDIYHRQISLSEFAEVQRKYGISIDALMYKAKETQMIPESKYRSYFILKSSRPAFKKYAEDSRIADEHSERFDTLVFDALSRDLISVSKASSLLDMPFDDVMRKSLVM